MDMGSKLFLVNRQSWIFGIIRRFLAFPFFGRVYAACNGVFIVLSILRGWGIDKKAPDLYDWNGALVCLAVASMNLFAPNHQGYFLYLFILNDRVVLLICGVTIERRPHPYHWQSQTLSI
jgi:drug/metabolite transporter superfamily protein YnfA